VSIVCANSVLAVIVIIISTSYVCLTCLTCYVYLLCKIKFSSSSSSTSSILKPRKRERDSSAGWIKDRTKGVGKHLNSFKTFRDCLFEQ